MVVTAAEGLDKFRDTALVIGIQVVDAPPVP